MILIADSGSTKTEWCLAGQRQATSIFTQGINPFHQDDVAIARILKEELLPQIGEGNSPVQTVWFYGAGLRHEMKDRMRSLIAVTLDVPQVFAESDLLAAARALFGREEGIACILGTGANSGLYDGERILANTPPLGFILGDEGSGAYLGKMFLADLCKGLLPKSLLDDYMRVTGQSVADVIDAVYRKPLPNRYLAQTTMYISQKLHMKEMADLVRNSFRTFFQRNLIQYQRHDLPVRAIGSVAYYFQDSLREAALMEGFHIDRVEKGPMGGLIDYHSSSI